MNGNQMDTTCSAVTSKTSVYCSGAFISDLTGIQYFDNLKSLTCAGNMLSFLPDLPAGLTDMDCQNNQLAFLPDLPATLKSINCGENLLGQLPVLPAGLTWLGCPFNQLGSLPTLPGTLTELWCGGNQMTWLPTLPASLKIFSCETNPLGVIPPLPAGIEALYVQYTQISYLPALPDSLIHLQCHDNMLTALPALPAKLQYLYCEYNQLTTLPTIPESLNYIYANNNQLTSLPELPNTMSLLDVRFNPGLACLPKLTNIQTLKFGNTAVACLPNYGNVNNSSPSLGSIPLCGVFNPNGCPFFWNISGTAWADPNANCVIDTVEKRLRYLKVSLDSAGTIIQQTTTGKGGHYSFDTDTGTYMLTVDTAALPVTVSCPPSGVQTSVLTALDSLDYGIDFGFACKAGFDVGVKSVVADSGALITGDTLIMRVAAGDMARFYGLSCAAGTAGTVTVTVTGPVAYLGPAPGALTPSTAGLVLSYTVADFGTVDPQEAFRFYLSVDTAATTGTSVCFDVTVTPSAGDLYPANNQLMHCGIVKSSFDPNIKEVYPEGAILPTQEWLTYTVHFQNTGTAPAEHIYLLDTLDASLDVASFEFLAASHPVIMQLTGPVTRFNFPNINLPDSASDEPGSHGFMQYRVRLKGGLAIGTVIANTAHIYFDFNPPVTTNTVTDTLALPAGIAPAAGPVSFAIHPNPVTETLYVHFDEDGARPDGTLTLFDPQGRKLWSLYVNVNERQKTVDLHELENGMYLLRFATMAGSVLTKRIMLTR